MNNLNKNRIYILIGMAALIYFTFSGNVFASSIAPADIISLANKDRIEQSVGVLNESSTLDKAALEKATDMFQNNYFAHTSPQGLSPWYWFEKNGYDYTYAGENLAIGFSNAKDEETAWMNSPEHRKNILNANYQEIGAAAMEGKMNGEDTIIAVQLFGTRVKSAQSMVKGSTMENNGLDNQLMPENKVQGLSLPTSGTYQLDQTNSKESLVAQAADFVQNFDLEKMSLFAAGLMLAMCFLINFAAIIFIVVNSISNLVSQKVAENSPNA